MIEGVFMSKVEGRRKVEDVFWEIFEKAQLKFYKEEPVRFREDKSKDKSKDIIEKAERAKKAIKIYLERPDRRMTLGSIIADMSRRFKLESQEREKADYKQERSEESEEHIQEENEEYMEIIDPARAGAMTHGPGESSPEEISVAQSRLGREYFFKVGPGNKVTFVGYSVGGSGRPEDVTLGRDESLYSLVFYYKKFGEKALKAKGVNSPESNTTS
jgi:hypothetical protein